MNDPVRWFFWGVAVGVPLGGVLLYLVRRWWERLSLTEALDRDIKQLQVVDKAIQVYRASREIGLDLLPELESGVVSAEDFEKRPRERLYDMILTLIGFWLLQLFRSSFRLEGVAEKLSEYQPALIAAREEFAQMFAFFQGGLRLIMPAQDLANLMSAYYYNLSDPNPLNAQSLQTAIQTLGKKAD